MDVYQGILSALIRLCMDRHWPVEATFRHAGYDLTELRLGGRMLTTDQFMDLLGIIAHQHHAPTLALDFGRDIHSEQLGVFGGLIATSANLSQAVQRFAQFKPLLDLALDLSLRCDDAGVWVVYQSNDHTPIGQHRYYPELLFSALLAQGQQFLAAPCLPLAVQFRHHAPAYAADYAHYFACPIHFGAPVDALLLPEHLLYQPFMTASQRFHQHLLTQAAAQCPNIQPRFADQLTAYLRAHLHDAPACTLQAIATHFSLSHRTLQRKLQQENTSLNMLRDQLRQQQACKLLLETQLPIEQIAHMLGFAYPSSFNACFLTWTQQTPSQYRMRQHRNKGAKPSD